MHSRDRPEAAGCHHPGAHRNDARAVEGSWPGVEQQRLKDYTTPDGASVLVVRDPAQLEAVKATLFEAKPLSDLGKAESGGCP